MSKICSKLTIKTPEGRHRHRSGVFIVNFEHVSHIFLEFPLSILNKQIPKLTKKMLGRNSHFMASTFSKLPIKALD